MSDLARCSAAMAHFVADILAGHPGRAAFAPGYSNGTNILAAMTFDHVDLFDRAALLHTLFPLQHVPNPGLAGHATYDPAKRRDKRCSGLVPDRRRDGGHRPAQFDQIVHQCRA